MPVILHIGAHKTGTTLVQKTFCRHRFKLARHGVIYPRSNLYAHAHHRLAFALKGKRDPARGDIPELSTEISRLAAALAKRPPGATAFLSSEALFDLPRASIGELKSHLNDEEITILAVLRRPDEMLLSIYNQNLKDPRNGFTAPFADFAAAPETLSRDIAMRSCVESWASVFGAERIVLRRFEDDGPVDIALDAVGLPRGLLTARGRPNASTSAMVGELMRAGKARGLTTRQRTRLFRRAVRRFGAGPRFEPGEEIRCALLASMQEDLTRLFATYGLANNYTPDAVPDGLVPTPPMDVGRDLDRLLRWPL